MSNPYKIEGPAQISFSDRPNYAALKVIALQPQLDFGEVSEDSLPCECVD